MAQNSRSVMLLFIIINDMESELSTKNKMYSFESERIRFPN